MKNKNKTETTVGIVLAMLLAATILSVICSLISIIMVPAHLTPKLQDIVFFRWLLFWTTVAAVGTIIATRIE